MRTPAEKKAKTLRFSAEGISVLENMARVKQQSESQVAETAIIEYAKSHGFYTRYTMTANKLCYALLKQDGQRTTVVDQQIRNGVPLEDIRQTYAARFNAPVELVLEDGANQ